MEEKTIGRQSETEQPDEAVTAVSDIAGRIAYLRTAAEAEREQLEPYLSFYRREETEPYTGIAALAPQKGRYGWTCVREQGYNGWRYAAEQNGTVSPMTLDGDVWCCGEALADCDVLSPAGDDAAMYEFVSTASRAAEIRCRIRAAADGSDFTFSVSVDGQMLWPADGEIGRICGDDRVGRWLAVPAELKEGSVVRFTVRSADGGAAYARLTPTVEYDVGSTVKKRLHALPKDAGAAYGWFGDVHPFYDNGRLYLYHLWLDTTFHTALITSDDLLHYQYSPFRENGMTVLGAVQSGEEYLSIVGGQRGECYISHSDDLMSWNYSPKKDAATGMKTDSVPVDTEEYPFNGRDPYLFYDPDINRFRATFMAYRSGGEGGQNRDRSIVLFTSEDAEGRLWTKESRELKRFPNDGDGDPECSMMMQIGSRWYLFTSMGRSEVGRLSYWFGGEGQSIDEVDWVSCDEHFLEGIGLKAAQLEKIDGKPYVFGWMSNNPLNRADWGGWMNLPREVVQQPDGRLGTRWDPALLSLINQGRLTDPMSGKTSATVYREDPVAGPVYVTADVTVGPGESGGILIDNNRRAYFIKLDRAENTVTIGSDGKVVFSSMELDLIPDDVTQFTVRVIVDAPVIEAVVNDICGVCASTTLKNTDELTFGVCGYGSETAYTVDLCRLADLDSVLD